MSERAVIYGFEGMSLNAAEKTFFASVNPWGYIVFARNIDNPQQLLALTDELRSLSGRADVPVLIDQEGGRVARLRGPHWRDAPPAAVFGEAWARDPQTAREATWANSRLLAHELKACGINVDCVPMLDIRSQGSNEIVIGDRAYSDDPAIVSALGRAAAEGLLAGGVLPVIKHLPGHGRSFVDSHDGLPIVEASLEELEASDFIPFRALNDMPLGMTGHLIFTAIDPKVASTLSKRLINEAIRSSAPGRIGFDGLLMTDDLSMGALEGDFETRTRASLDAGCDMILHCNGDMAEMRAIAGQTPLLAGRAQERAEAAIAAFREPDDFDPVEARNRLQEIVMAN
jgi:beta-N-acetylhexosaminidase